MCVVSADSDFLAGHLILIAHLNLLQLLFLLLSNCSYRIWSISFTFPPFFSFSFLLAQYSCLHFLPTPPLHPNHNHRPPLLPHSPLVLSMCALYYSWKPLSLLSPPDDTLAIVRLLLISRSLVIFCLLFCSVDYVPVKGEIIWYVSLTAWLISLTKMLSSSLHAVAKGISSFFLSVE